MIKKKKLLLFAPLALAGFAVFVALGGWLVMLLWNWLAPALFAWKEVTFWQALGLLALCRILFGGFGGGGPYRRSRWRAGERWRHMTPEERERFCQGMRAGASGEPAPDARTP